jgi:arylsulfatase A-like enzyme
MATKRNVIVFLVDDCGREYLSCYDQVAYNPASPVPRVDPLTRHWANQWGEAQQDRSRFRYPRTPWLNRAAKNGLLFERMNVAAMCSPTRSSLLTGKHNQDHTIGNAIQGTDVKAFGYRGKTIYNLMKEQSSRHTGIHIGKWHVSNSYLHSIEGMPLGRRNSERSFQTPVRDGGATYFSGGVLNFGHDVPGYEFGGNGQHHQRYVRARHDDRTGEFHIEKLGTHSLIDETESAIAAIERARAEGRPFLMNVWFHAVHTPTDWVEMGGAELSQEGFHSLGASDPGDDALRITAFVEAVDTACQKIYDALTPAERDDTMIVYLSDNGSTARMLDTKTSPSLPPAGPDGNPYSRMHSKRSPWQGGIGAACVMLGPDIVDPGGGRKPRVWSGLCGVEDLFHQLCRWTGVNPVVAPGEDSTVIERALANSGSDGRRDYTQRAFTNGFHDDIFSEAQEGAVRFVSQQNAAGWKLLWVRAGSEPKGDVTWEWQLYAMHRDPLEAENRFPDKHAGGTIQQRYDALSGMARTQFNELYQALRDANLIPPRMAVNLS